MKSRAEGADTISSGQETQMHTMSLVLVAQLLMTFILHLDMNQGVHPESVPLILQTVDITTVRFHALAISSPYSCPSQIRSGLLTFMFQEDT